MGNELIFEHLINARLSNCLRWADLYRAASVVGGDGKHDIVKVSKVEICLYMALNNLLLENGDESKIIGNAINKLQGDVSFEIIDDILSDLSQNRILF